MPNNDSLPPVGQNPISQTADVQVENQNKEQAAKWGSIVSPDQPSRFPAQEVVRRFKALTQSGGPSLSPAQSRFAAEPSTKEMADFLRKEAQDFIYAIKNEPENPGF